MVKCEAITWSSCHRRENVSNVFYLEKKARQVMVDINQSVSFLTPLMSLHVIDRLFVSIFSFPICFGYFCSVEYRKRAVGSVSVLVCSLYY